MFGRVTYARRRLRRERSLFTSFTFCKVTGSCLLLLTLFRFVQLLTWLFHSQIGFQRVWLIRYIQQRDDRRDLFTLDDCITVEPIGNPSKETC